MLDVAEDRTSLTYVPIDSRPSLESIDRVRFLWEPGERAECTALLGSIPGVRRFVSQLEPIYGEACVCSRPLFDFAVRAAHAAVAKLGIEPLTEEAVRRGFPIYVGAALSPAPWLLLHPQTAAAWRLRDGTELATHARIEWQQGDFPFDRRTIGLFRLHVLRRTLAMSDLLRLRSDLAEILFCPVPNV